MRKSLIPDGKISRGVRDGLALRAQLLKAGKPEAEVDRAVGQVLKRAWQSSVGNVREPWKYLCEHCRDTGWITVDPSVEELARLTRLYGPNPSYQGYVMKCEPCRWNTRERELRRRRFEEDEPGMTGIGQRKRTRR